MTFRAEAELRDAADAGRLVETEQLDLKRELAPGESGNRGIARDLAAFSLGGGQIIVGVDEGPPVTLSPIPLAGQRERVEQVARQRVDPPVRCTVTAIQSEPAHTGLGYLLIAVPASAEAPHAVDQVFYARFGTTNSRLGPAELRRLFAAEGQTTATTAAERAGPTGTVVVRPAITELVDRWMEADPTPHDQRHQAHVFVVARPVDASAEMLQDAVGPGWEAWTRRAIVDGRDRLDREWSPDLGSLWRFERVPDGWRATSDRGQWPSMSEKRETHWLEIELGEDGTVRVFSGRGSDHRQDGARVIIELIIGGTVRRAVEAASVVTEVTGYQGRWDIGIAVTNLRGALSYFRHDNWWVEAEDLPPYRDDEYRRTWSGTTSELSQDLDAVVERLVGPLNRTLNEGRFQLPRPPAPPTPEVEPG